MNYLQQIIEEEYLTQKKILADAERILKKAPEGYLNSKRRKNAETFYHVMNKGGKTVYYRILDNDKILEALVDKKICKAQMVSASENLKYLKALRHAYKANQVTDVIRELRSCYKSAINVLGRENNLNLEDDYDRAPFDPLKHIHETTSGILVRSKSEVIIANALTSYHIPFRYEECFPYADDNGNAVYPDFTFHLPTGEIKIWEHFGLLSKLSYSLHCGEKLSLYQKCGYVLYKNLIITEDDARGNCSSALTDQIIRRELLPYYR